jgi:hypothetical protein
MSASEALIIGAGPFGLSISAHLHALGVDHRIVGRPMDTWRAHMPVGMNLKSEPYASSISAPRSGYGIPQFCGQNGLEYIERVGPLTLERFLRYADWFHEQLVPDVLDVTVTDVSAVGGGFRVTFEEGEPLMTRQVIVATGVLPYAALPAELSGLSSDLVSHSSELHRLDHFQGRRVAVVGAGQSALESAALLHEAGADVCVIVRSPALNFVDPNPDRVGPVGRIRRPVTNLCEGWRCAFWNTPDAFRRLPQDMRIAKARSVLGPSGSWWLKDRIEGVVEVLAGQHVRTAAPNGDGVRLSLDGRTQSAIDVDHVVAGTGFPIDIARLPFLPDQLRKRTATVDGFPVLSRAGESTVPGLYFTGAPASGSLGPSMRFIAGTHNLAGKLARSVARRSKSGRGSSLAAEMSDQPVSR